MELSAVPLEKAGDRAVTYDHDLFGQAYKRLRRKSRYLAHHKAILA
jgi:hypothetical protein